MPKIHAYQEQVGSSSEIGGGRRATASDYGGGGRGADDLGRAIWATGDMIADTVERQEVSDIQAKLAQANAEWTNHFNERASQAAPGDPTFASKFNDDLGGYLAKMEEGIGTNAGRLAFKRGAGEMSAHFVKQTGAFQVASAGAKAKADYLVLLDANRNVLLSDPTQFDRLVQLSTAAINDPSGPYARMPAADREALATQTRKELALSQYQGIIQNGGAEMAKRKLLNGDGDAYLDADNKKALIDSADQAIRLNDAKAAQARAEAERVRQEKQEATMKGFIARIIDPKGQGGPLGDKEIIAASMRGDIDSKHMEHLAEYRLRRARELKDKSENASNPTEVRRLMNEMIADVDDPKKVFNVENVRASYRAGKISTRDLTFLEDRFARLKDGSTNSFEKDANTALSRASRVFTTSFENIGQPEKAASLSQRMAVDFFQQVEEYRAAKKNPRDLLNPEHKDSPFSEARIKSYLKGGQQAVGEAADTVRRDARNPRGTPTPPIGQVRTFAQGKFKYKGGDVNQQSSWEAVK